MAALHAFQLGLARGQPAAAGFEALAPGEVAPGRTGYDLIRHFLRGAELDPNGFYGFFGLTPGALPMLPSVRTTADRAAADLDVLLCGAEPIADVFFWNVFEQGEVHHPGLEALMQRCLKHLGRPQALDRLASPALRTAPPNGFFARARFWHEWLDLAESLAALAEEPSGELGAALRATADSPGGAAPLRLLLSERLASYLLMSERAWRTVRCTPAAPAAWPVRARALEALKLAAAVTGRDQYRVVFRWLRGAGGARR